MKSTTPNVETVLISEAKTHFQAAQAALRKGCEHALLTGLRLITLHSKTAGNGHGGARTIGSSVTRDTLEKGFNGACEKIGIETRTAYRWMDATYKACIRATLVMEGEELLDELPEPGTPRWETWEHDLRKVAQGMSLNRLLLGTSKPSTEEHRYDELVSADEEGRQIATELLQGVADGKYSLVAAVRALGSKEAYERLRAEGGEKVRKDPVYLMMDGETGEVGGLFVKSVTTLRNTFQHWEDAPAAARKKARVLWLEVVSSLPADLKNG